ncbi:hypothetical protein ACNKHW_08215 [Shigella flexneri]
MPGARKARRRNGWQGALFSSGKARCGEERRRNLPPLTFAPGCSAKSGLAQAEHHLVADIATGGY